MPFHSVRRRFATKQYGDFDGDFRFDINEHNFKIKVFLPVLDTILCKLKNRFEGLQTVLSYFKFLSPLEIIKNNEDYIIIKIIIIKMISQQILKGNYYV